MTEFEGKDLQDALHQAALRLGIPEPDLDYRIVEQGRRGVFGLGARSVRITVVSPSPPEGRAVAPPVRATPVRRSETPPEQLGELERITGRIVALMGLQLQLEVVVDEGGAQVDLFGPDEAALSHKDGELKLALQFLLNRMARRCWPAIERVHVTTGRARHSRDEELVESVRQAALGVAQTGKPRRLDPMNAYERRLVHITVREFDGLASRSEGNGLLKQVRIFKA